MFSLWWWWKVEGEEVELECTWEDILHKCHCTGHSLDHSFQRQLPSHISSDTHEQLLLWLGLVLSRWGNILHKCQCRHHNLSHSFLTLWHPHTFWDKLEYRDHKYQQTDHNWGHRLQWQWPGHICLDMMVGWVEVGAHRPHICPHTGDNWGHTAQSVWPAHKRLDMLAGQGCHLWRLVQVLV